MDIQRVRERIRNTEALPVAVDEPTEIAAVGAETASVQPPTTSETAAAAEDVQHGESAPVAAEILPESEAEAQTNRYQPENHNMELPMAEMNEFTSLLLYMELSEPPTANGLSDSTLARVAAVAAETARGQPVNRDAAADKEDVQQRGIDPAAVLPEPQALPASYGSTGERVAAVTAENLQQLLENAPVVPLEEAAEAQPNGYLPQFISNFISFYMEVCKYFMIGTEPKMSNLDGLHQAMDEFINEDSEEQRKLMFEQLVRHIDRQPLLFCSFCDRCMFTARQTFMHIGSKQHAEKFGLDFRRLNNLLTKIVGENRVKRMFQQATERVKSLQSKLSSASLDDPELRPTREFYEKWSNIGANSGGNIKNAFTLEERLNRKSAKGIIFMKKVTEHIGRAKTRCFDCKLIFPNGAEYYTHLLTFFHLGERWPEDSPFTGTP
ncbi:hypothetical protein PMAYCL1PPCAC_00570, partial [Pristionchus mayeri]